MPHRGVPIWVFGIYRYLILMQLKEADTDITDLIYVIMYSIFYECLLIAIFNLQISLLTCR